MLRRIALLLALLCIAPRAGAQGVVRSVPSVQTATLSVWNSGTALNATQTIFGPGDAAFGEILVHLVQSAGTFSAGAITYEVSYDNTNWVTIPADAVTDPSSTTYAQVAVPYTLVTSTNKPFLLAGKGWQGLRIKLSTAITGTGTVTPNVTYLPYETVNTAIALSPTAANFNATVSQAGTWSGLRIVGNSGTSLDGTTAGILDFYQRPSTSANVALSNAVKLTVTSSVNVKASAGNVYGVSANNGAAAVCWVQFINSAGAGTLGTGVIFSVVMPTSGTVTIPPGALALGNFSTGIAVGIASATNSSTACGTAGNLTVFYQ